MIFIVRCSIGRLWRRRAKKSRKTLRHLWILTLMPLSRFAYIKNEFQKLDMYKRIASIQNVEEYGEMLDELIDRFGELAETGSQSVCWWL